MSQENPIFRINILNVSETEFSIRELPHFFDGKNPIELDNLLVRTSMDFAVLPDEEKMIMQMVFVSELKDEDNLLPVFRFGIMITYQISGIGAILGQNDHPEVITLEPRFARYFTNATIHTARGYLAARTASYGIHRFPLPMLDADLITIDTMQKKEQEAKAIIGKKKDRPEGQS